MEKNTKIASELVVLTPVVTLLTEAMQLVQKLATPVIEITQNGVSGTMPGFDAGESFNDIELRLTHLSDELSIRETRIDEITKLVVDIDRKLDMVIQFFVTPQEARVLTKRAASGITIKPVNASQRKTQVAKPLVNAPYKVTTKTIIHPESAILYREIKQYSQAEMANDLDVSLPTIGNWETGNTRIRPGFRGGAKVLHGRMLEVNHKIKYMTNKAFTRQYPKKRNTRK